MIWSVCCSRTLPSPVATPLSWLLNESKIASHLRPASHAVVWLLFMNEISSSQKQVSMLLVHFLDSGSGKEEEQVFGWKHPRHVQSAGEARKLPNNYYFSGGNFDRLKVLPSTTSTAISIKICIFSSKNVIFNKTHPHHARPIFQCSASQDRLGLPPFIF